MKSSFEYELEVRDTLDDTYTKTLEVQLDFSYSIDHHYGADADGNRGVRALSVEDLDIKLVDETGKDVTDMVKSEFKADFKKIEEEAEEHAYWTASEEDNGGL